MHREFDDTVHNGLNYCCPEPQGRRRGPRVNARRECKDSFDNLKNHSHPCDFKQQNFSSHGCPFQSIAKDIRLTTASEQQLETDVQPRKSQKQKCRSPLTSAQHLKHSPENPLDLFSHDFESVEFPHCIERCPGKSLEKSSKKKMKEEIIHDCTDPIVEGDVLRVDKKRHRRNIEKGGKQRIQKCLNELEVLESKAMQQFECEKRFSEPRKRNPLSSKMCQKVLTDDLGIDAEDEEEQNRRLQRDLENIPLCEPFACLKRRSRTPEMTSSATEASITGDMDGRAQRNPQYDCQNDNKPLQQTHDDSVSSEATGSENDEDREDTLRAVPRAERNNPHFIDHLKGLRFRYLDLMQMHLDHLYDLELFMKSLTSENSKSGDPRGEKGRAVTRSGLR